MGDREPPKARRFTASARHFPVIQSHPRQPSLEPSFEYPSPDGTLLPR
jgi:hypothetical protein